MKEIAVAIISGIFTIVGVVLSHYLSERRTIQQRKVQGHDGSVNEHLTAKEAITTKGETIRKKQATTASFTPNQFLTSFIMLAIEGMAWGAGFAAVAVLEGKDSTGAAALIIFMPILAYYSFLCFMKYHHYFSTLIGLIAMSFNLFVVIDILA